MVRNDGAWRFVAEHHTEPDARAYISTYICLFVVVFIIFCALVVLFAFCLQTFGWTRCMPWLIFIGRQMAFYVLREREAFFRCAHWIGLCLFCTNRMIWATICESDERWLFRFEPKVFKTLSHWLAIKAEVYTVAVLHASHLQRSSTEVRLICIWWSRGCGLNWRRNAFA